MKGQELKHRINGVRETVKITKAMQMISASKLYKSQQKFESSRKYLWEVTDAVNLLMTPDNADHPYFEKHERSRAAFIVIASDKGLCGDFNHEILDAAYQEILKREVVKVFAVGHMAKDYFKKKNVKLSNAYIHLTLEPTAVDARLVADDIIKEFVDKKIDKVYLAFSEAQTVSTHIITIKKILPIKYVEQEDGSSVFSNKDSVSNMLNNYVWAEIYYALSSAYLVVNYKRMTAMQQSTTNGEEMIEDLVLQYNHKRQESITTELVDASTSLQGKRL